ncbi:MAG: MFS transporter, partial [Deltaproteobacteria bacterium]|nr:MFS transporter [Deltaproteobacteria bacterium]
MPSLYFAEGIPYVLVMSVSVVLYKRLDVDNAAIALYTSLLYLPWVIKGGWSPLVDLVATKRRWITACQALLAVALLGVAGAVLTPMFFALTVALLATMAFVSATHDIAADGFYMLGLDAGQQAALVGVRSTFYRIAVIFGQGGVVVLAGVLEPRLGVPIAWATAFVAVAAVMAALSAYHGRALPRPAADMALPRGDGHSLWGDVGQTFAQFFQKPRLGALLAFLLLYRLAEAQLVKLVAPFLLDGRDRGGLGL